MDSCHSSSKQEEEQNSSDKTPAPHFLILPLCSPPFHFVQTSPFFRQPLSFNPSSFPLLAETTNAVRAAHDSIASNLERCLKMLDSLRSQNGVLDKILSFPSFIENGLKIQRRNCRNLAMISNTNFAAILPGDSVAGMVAANGILNFLNIYNTLLVVRLVLTWFPNAPPAVVSPLSTLCDPYLNIFRGIIPPLGGLDLSPILAFLVLNAFTSTAQALPAELPPTEAATDMPSPSHLTTSQKKWMTRISGNKPKRPNDEL